VVVNFKPNLPLFEALADNRWGAARVAGDAVRGTGSIARIHELAQEFRAYSRPPANAAMAALVLRLIAEHAIQLFELVSRDWIGESRFGADNDRCLSGLLTMLAALNSGTLPPPFELEHALDALVIQLLRFDGERAGAAGRAGRGR